MLRMKWLWFTPNLMEILSIFLKLQAAKQSGPRFFGLLGMLCSSVVFYCRLYICPLCLGLVYFWLWVEIKWSYKWAHSPCLVTRPIRSAVCNKNRIGPKTEPWSTSELTDRPIGLLMLKIGLCTNNKIWTQVIRSKTTSEKQQNGNKTANINVKKLQFIHNL